jgi:membrane protein DedA with SNARE-associated domain
MYNIGGIVKGGNENKKWYNNIKYFMEKNGFPTIVVVSAIPNPLTNVAAITAGSIGYPLWKFLIAAWIGNWIQFTSCAVFGSLIQFFHLHKLGNIVKNRFAPFSISSRS